MCPGCWSSWTAPTAPRPGCWRTKRASSAGNPPWLIGRLRPRSYQRGFVGKDHGLDAIAQAELGQYPADVDLHRARGQVQAVGDFAVGHARGDEGEDVLLAAGQRAADLLGALAVSGLGLAGMLGSELADETLRGARRENGVTG